MLALERMVRVITMCTFVINDIEYDLVIITYSVNTECNNYIILIIIHYHKLYN